MKKIIKSRIFLVIIIMIICINGTLYAATTYKASDVVYKSSDGTSMNVNDALNDLYNKSNNSNITLVDGYSIKFVTQRPTGVNLKVYTYLYKNGEQIGYYENTNTGVYTYGGSNNAISVTDENRNIKVTINYSSGSGYGNFTIKFWIDDILMYEYQNNGGEYSGRNSTYDVKAIVYYNNKIYLENLNQ